MTEITESPVYLVFDPSVSPKRKDLPVTLFETGADTQRQAEAPQRPPPRPGDGSGAHRLRAVRATGGAPQSQMQEPGAVFLRRRLALSRC